MTTSHARPVRVPAARKMNRKSRPRAARRALVASSLACAVLAALLVVSHFKPLATAHAQSGPTVFINEIHYDNEGADSNEGVEIAGPAGTDIGNWKIVHYNGTGGTVTSTTTIPAGTTIPNQQNGFGTLFFPVVLENDTEAVALVTPLDVVRQFISYEGLVTATQGPADEFLSTDIGVDEEPPAPAGWSLQLRGHGDSYDDFIWHPFPRPHSRGTINPDQTFAADTVSSYVVNSTADPGTGACDAAECTLREAITAANADGGAETITFTVTGQIDLQNFMPELTTSMNLQGPGASQLTVRRGVDLTFRIFTTAVGTNVRISGLTVSNGAATGTTFPNHAGAGVFSSGNLTLDGVVVSGNTSVSGSGGGVFNDQGVLTITNSTISGNSAFEGGGVFSSFGSLVMTNSTVSGNSARNAGGGVRTNFGTDTLTSVTITNNRADSDADTFGTGGGIQLNGNDPLLLQNSIVADNYRGAGTAAEDDIAGGTLSSASSFNLIGAGGAGGLADGVNSNRVGVASPGLGPLAANGGQTPTHALTLCSPAIDKGFSFGLPADQRGQTRPVNLDDATFPNAPNNGNGSDIGAFEVQASADLTPPAVQSIVRASANPAVIGSSVQFTVTFTESVTGVDASDFAVTAGGSVANASVTSVGGSGSTYTVTVSTGTGAGTVRLDVVDDNTIADASGNPLGGCALGDGNFTTGESFTTQLPAISVSDVTKAEGNSGTTTFTFVVSLNGPSQFDVLFDIATTSNTATSSDYEVNFLVNQTIPAGQTTYNFNVPVFGDTTQEPNETFFVSLINVRGATVADGSGTGTILNDDGAPAAGQIVISEFRLRGPGADATQQANNEFIELYNNTDSDFVVVDSAPVALGTNGWAIVSSDDPLTPKYVIPVGTTIPARAHFLVTNALGYSLSSYAAADTVAGPAAASYNADIPDGAGLALYRTGTPLPTSGGDTLDRVGFRVTGTPFSEGLGLDPQGGVASPVEHSFVRRLTSGRPQDTNDNAADFQFVSADGGAYNGAQSILGAPGPQNTQSPLQRNDKIKASLIDPTVSSGAPPNSVRRMCDDLEVEECDQNRSQFGTFSIRRRFTNNTGTSVTQLRFRIVDITTLNSPGYAPGNTQADLRAISAPSATLVQLPSGSLTLDGTAPESPSSSTLGGGLNSTVATGLVSLGGTLAPGQSVNLQFLLGVQRPGAYRFFVNVEAATGAQVIAPPQSKAGAAQTKSGKGEEK